MPMLLSEEYLYRNNIKLPLIRFQKKSGVFLKSQNTMDIRVLAFSWINEDAHPGFYRRSYLEAVHDGYNTMLMKDLLNEGAGDNRPKFHVDIYDKCVFDSVQQVKKDGYYAVEAKEQLFTAWNFFLKIYDSFFSKTMNQPFFELAGMALSSHLSTRIRTQALEGCVRQLDNLHPRVSKLWRFKISHLTNSFEDQWLIRLINEK